IELAEFAKYRAELRAKDNIKPKGEDLAKDPEFLKDLKATENGTSLFPCAVPWATHRRYQSVAGKR
ncbi:MAG: hypothetical protein Q9180_009739, partial [Flavoplaca navasiana]